MLFHHLHMPLLVGLNCSSYLSPLTILSAHKNSHNDNSCHSKRDDSHFQEHFDQANSFINRRFRVVFLKFCVEVKEGEFITNRALLARVMVVGGVSGHLSSLIEGKAQNTKTSIVYKCFTERLFGI